MIFFSFISLAAYAHAQSFDDLLQSGKNEFSKDFDQQDFNAAVNSLTQAVALRPDNAEAHYFLGYAYSKLNALDANGIIAMSLPLTQKTSEQFELVNKLTPKYTGETLWLDPYSKLTSEWGTMAMCYWYNGEKDSALWAFREGKKKGGFSDFYLAINRKVLDECTPDAFLISSGDIFTIPLWYLQIVENYRPDVTVIDVAMLNATWYPSYLAQRYHVPFGLSESELNAVDLCSWTDSTISISINDSSCFFWLVKPSYYDTYLLRGDRLFLSLLQENEFKHNIFFTTAFTEDSRLSLGNYLQSFILTDRLNYDNQDPLGFEQYKATIIPVLECVRFINPNSQHELYLLDNIRYSMFGEIYNCIQNNRPDQSRELMDLLDQYAGVPQYPFQSDDGLKYYHLLKEKI